MEEFLVYALAALLIGLAKGGFSVTGALAVPLMVMVMPVTQATGLILPLLMIGDVFALYAYWKTWDLKHVKLLLPAAIIGILVGVVFLTNLSDIMLRRLIGIFTIVVGIYKITSDLMANVKYTPRRWHGYLAGGTAGFASALANAGGPPITAYLLLQKLPSVSFIGTSVLFFAIVNWIKLPLFISTNVTDVDKLLSIIWVALIIPVGVWLGREIIKRINQRVFEWLMLIFLFYAGFTLLFSG